MTLTWVLGAMLAGIWVNLVSLHTTASLPLRHMQEQYSGHWGPAWPGRLGPRHRHSQTTARPEPENNNVYTSVIIKDENLLYRTISRKMMPH